ncbi:MAG: hypothetical protein JWO36_2024 [Myxococcales bacterium]|nr:hypothetical protein [Myxococcales bacterium]
MACGRNFVLGSLMLRTTILGLALAFCGCHHDPEPIHAGENELPPLPPASGTPVGYLIDSADNLKLRDEQIKKLKEIDTSLAAQDASIDTQLRQIEKPTEEEEEPQPKGPGAHPRKRHNNAPGQNMTTTADAAKLHDMRAANDRDALKKALALLDPAQQESALKILEDRGIEVGKAKKHEAGGDDGTPLPGAEP